MIRVGRKCVAVDCISLADVGELCAMHYKLVQRIGGWH